MAPVRPIFVVVAFVLGAVGALAGGKIWLDHRPSEFGSLPTEDIERVVAAYMRDYPQAFMEAIETYQDEIAYRGFQLLVKGKQEELFNDPESPAVGNPGGDVTVVEFFDYRCPYCKKVTKTVMDLVADDPNLRVVFKEYPVLSRASAMAARAALASRKQDKYLPFHVALMGLKGRFDEISVMRVADEIGLDTDRLRQDMQDPAINAIIDANIALGRVLGARGTPAFIIGDRLVIGFVHRKAFETYIDAARALAADARSSGS